VNEDSRKQAELSTSAEYLKAKLDEYRKAPSEDLQIQAGSEMIKKLNDPVNSDAAGKEEVDRLGPFLQMKVLNWRKPGSVFGRDLELFEKQVESNIKAIEKTAKSLENNISKTFKQYGVPMKITAAEVGSQLGNSGWSDEEEKELLELERKFKGPK
jgi:hypothetical protein